MFQENLTSFTYELLPADGFCGERHARRYNAALNRFRSMLRQGNLSRLKNRLMHRPERLYDLDALKPCMSLRGSSYAGIQVVQISAITGTEGKTAEFDMGFHPLREESRERWVGLAMAYLSRLPLPPIQLVQIGDVYIVRDGHHRISVSRAFGQISMDAEVIAWQATPPFPSQAESVRPLAVRKLDPST